MHAEQLVQMVNDISAFFAPQFPEAEAAAEVAGHLKRQWEKRMRLQIVEILNSGEGAFSPVGRAAIALLAAEATRPVG
ncbi:MAG: formate dehydrogenase subunit delta [Pseudomonadota bacterium]